MLNNSLLLGGCMGISVIALSQEESPRTSSPKEKTAFQVSAPWNAAYDEEPGSDIKSVDL